MEIRWNKEHEMGIAELDHDHKQLFVIAGRLVDKVQDPKSIADVRVRLFVLREGVQYLRGYFDEHAIREEAYMRKIGYTDYALHKQLHDEFMANTLQGYEKMVERGTCSREEVLDFVGRGIGWLVEHISTADLAIVGRGTLGKPRLTQINAQVVEREFNTIFASTLNMDVQTRLIDPNYAGAPFGPAICQELTYRRGDRKVTVLAGLENSFLTAAAEAVYGAQLQGMEALIMSTMEIFSANFWRTVGSRFVEGDAEMVFVENHFLTQAQLQERYNRHIPKLSLLFDSSKGKFFVATETDIAAQAESFDLRVGA